MCGIHPAPGAAFPPQTCLSPWLSITGLYKQKVLHTCRFAGLLFSGTRSLGLYTGPEARHFEEEEDTELSWSLRAQRGAGPHPRPHCETMTEAELNLWFRNLPVGRV